MRKIWSGLVSCLVASAMIVTSNGVFVMADPLPAVGTEASEILVEPDDFLSEDRDIETGDNNVLTEDSDTLHLNPETADSKASADNVLTVENEITDDNERTGDNEGTVLSAGNGVKTHISEDEGNDTDTRIGLPIDIRSDDEGSRNRSVNKSSLIREERIGSESQAGIPSDKSGLVVNTQASTDRCVIHETDDLIRIYAGGSYHNWDGISNVTQFQDPNGGMYYAINSDDVVRIYRAVGGSHVSNVITLEKTHPMYGTAACDGEGNFYLVTGESNSTDDTSVETIFISKYDRNGNHIATTGDDGSSSCPYYPDDFHTKSPFDAGNCDAAVMGDILTVNYARHMYNGHQSNSVFSVNVKDMSKVSVGSFYESHSFAQRVVPVENGFVYVTEGDGYDRCFKIYNARKTDNGSFSGREAGIFDFWVREGTLDDYNMHVLNENFAHMGGLAALSDGRIAFTAQSARSLNSDASHEKEDVFIQIFDPSKDLTTAEAYTTEGIRSGLAGPNGRDEVTNYGVKWLTSLSDNESITNVQIAATTADDIVVLFEYYMGSSYKGVYYIVLDDNGNVIQPATLFNEVARLNPCEMPVYTDGMICWVGNSNSNSRLYIYSLELLATALDKPGFTPCGGIYTVPTSVEISCADKDATVHYTLDGSEPAKESPVYTEPLLIDRDTTIKAVAVKGKKVSKVTTESYRIADKKITGVKIADGRDIEKTYGDDDFTIKAIVTDKGEGTGILTWGSTDNEVAVISNTGTVNIKGAGECTIKALYESDTTIGETSVKLKVDKKTLGITWSNTSFEYDGELHKPTATLSGVESGDECTVRVYDEYANVGTYTATATLRGAASDNYILPENEKTCTFNIFKRLAILEQPHSVYAEKGSTFNITFTPYGEELKYQWYMQYKNEPWLAINPPTGTFSRLFYTVDDIILNSRFKCVVKDKYGDSLETDVVRVYEHMALILDKHAVTLVSKADSTAALNVEIRGPYDRDSLVWSSSDTSVATVDNGLVTAVEGLKEVRKAKITVETEDGELSDVCEVTVEPLKDDIIISQELVKGGRITDTSIAKTKDDGDKYSITYTVKGIASVSDKGVIQGKKTGHTVVTVTKASTIHTLDIEVIDPKFDAGTYSKNTGDKFNAGFDAKGLKVEYSSAKPAVASVDDLGNITANSKGSTTITAVVQGKKYTTKVNVFDPQISGGDTVYLDGKTLNLKVVNGSGNTRWTSSDEQIATVVNGKVKGLSGGKVIITAVNNERVMRKEIGVYRVPRFSEKKYSINDGEELAGIFDDADIGNVNYSSSNPGIASVDRSGKVTGLKKGSSKITAECGGKKYTTSVSVYSPVLSGSSEAVMLLDNKTLNLSVKNGTGKTEWSSSDESVAMVNNGKIKALSKGTTIVSAVNNGRKMDCEIHVYNVPKFDQKQYSVKAGESVTAALTKDEDLTGVEYSVSNTKVAVIDDNGVVTGIKKGTVTVTAKVAGRKYTAKVTVL